MSYSTSNWAGVQHFLQDWMSPSNDSDQPAHLRSLIIVFEGHSVGSQGSNAISGGQRDWSYYKKTCLFKYTENFTTKNWKLSDKKSVFFFFFFFFFLFFGSKHRLRILVRTASLRRFYRVPTIYVLSRTKKKNVYSVNLSLTI